QVNEAGAELGDILGSLVQQGLIGAGNIAVIGDGLGNYVGNAAARRAGGLQYAIVLNPDSALGGYVTPPVLDNFQHSVSYETGSLLDTNNANAGFNETLNTGDINNPLFQHTYGIFRLTQQIIQGYDFVLQPTFNAGPD